MKRLMRKVLLCLGLDVVPRQNGRVYPSFEVAARNASALGSNYDSAETARCVVKSTIRYRDQLQSLLRERVSPMLSRRLLALHLCAPGGSLNVLDFGGGAGQHYFEAAAFFSERLALRWHVVETKAVASAARVLESQSLKFFSSLAKALVDFKPDLVFSSGALQCMPDPLAELRKLTRVYAKHLFLTRGAYCLEHENRYIVETSSLADQGPLPLSELSSSRAAYPLTVAPLSEAEAALREAYEILYRFEETDLLGNLIGTERALRMAHFCRLKNTSLSS